MNKKRVAVLFGGKSAEHEVSLQSAKNIIDALDKDKYEVILVGIDKLGKWHLQNGSKFLLNSSDPKLIKLNNLSQKDLSFIPGNQSVGVLENGRSDLLPSIDIVFPVLHGRLGEDGAIQGMMELLDVPYVGAGILGSAIGMNKEIAKNLMRDAGIPIAKFLAINYLERDLIFFDKVEEELGTPFFVKPSDQGSSVGVSKVHKKDEYQAAIDLGFKFGNTILFEEAIVGREIECSVLGNENPIASVPGEIILRDEFYSYDTKYINDSGASLSIPADLSSEMVKRVQDLAIKTVKALKCEGMARVDFFLRDNELFVNEINTIPGFTKISMYPKLWEASGVTYSELLDKLIDLALKRYAREKRIQTAR